MSSKGILPDAAYGGLTVSTLPGPSGVTNAYVPPDSFTVSVPLTFYGAACAANRFDPQQLNAFESEMLSLAATLAPNGTWNAASVNNLSAAFQAWAQAFTGGVSLSPSSDYPSGSGSNSKAATPAYVTAAITAAGGSSLTKAVAANYPTVIANDTFITTPAYVQAAINGALAGSSTYPTDAADNAKGATPAYVTAAIAAATSTIEATVEALIPALTPAASVSNTGDGSAATPGFVHAAISAISLPVADPGANYPDNSNDSKYTTPAYVHAAYVAAVAAAIAASSSAATPLATGSDYPDASNDTKATTPAFVHAAVTAAEAAIPVLSTSSNYPGDAASNVKAATPAYVAAAVGAVSAGSSTLAGDSDVTISSPANKQVLEYNTGSSKWINANVPFDICVSITGTMTASEIVLQFVFPYAAQFAAGLGTSYAKASVGATGTPQITINKNGSAIGTINWAASATVATFTFASGVSFAAGDILQLVAPSSADATLANIGITLDGVKI